MRDRLRGLAAATLLLGVTVGLPLLLDRTVGDPLHAWPALRAGDLSDTTVTALLATVAYLAWASFVIPLTVEIVLAASAAITRRRHQLQLPLLGPQQDLARLLLGTVLLLLPAVSLTPSTANAAVPTGRVDLPVTAPHHVTPPASAGSAPAVPADHRDADLRRYVIPATGGFRSYWALADHFLGDGARWREIWDLNAGRIHTGGVVMDSPHRLDTGWTILIPPDGHADRDPTGPDGHGDAEVTVTPGDTLSGIATDRDLPTAALWAANTDRREPHGQRFTDPNLIEPGWTLTVPALPVTSRSTEAPAYPRPAPPAAVPTGHRRQAPAAARPSAPPPPSAPPSPAAPPSTAASTSAADPTRSPTPAGTAAAEDNHRHPIRVPLEIGLAAAAAITALDRARRIAQRRRRHGHRTLPPPPALLAAERDLRTAARSSRSTAAAVQLAAALSAATPVQVVAVTARDDDTVDLHLDTALPPPAPFQPTVDGWRLPADATGYTFGVDDLDDPYPALAPLGRSTTGTVLIDLAATGPVGIAGHPTEVTAYLTQLVTALAGAPWAARVFVHVPPTIGDRLPALDHVSVADQPQLPGSAATPAAADTVGAAPDPDASTRWSTTPIHLFCGWTTTDDIDDLLEAAGGPATDVRAVLVGVRPGLSVWTLTGDELTVPPLPTPITVTRPPGTDATARAVIAHAATAVTVPAGDPRLPDLAADAPPASRPTARQLNLLGPVELVGVDTPRRSQLLNLLTYLALHRRGVSRDQIITALWPDKVASTKTMRNRITEARVLVGGAISDGPTWKLDASITTDWQRFTALAAGTADEQHEALRLIRGRPFAGLDDVEWIDLEGFRAEIEAAIVDLALTVADRDLTAGDHDAAYTAARAGLLASRFDERLHRLAVRAAHAQGATGTVRTLQREMRVVLDLDIEPDDQMDPDTVALYDSISSRRP